MATDGEVRGVMKSDLFEARTFAVSNPKDYVFAAVGAAIDVISAKKDDESERAMSKSAKDVHANLNYFFDKGVEIGSVLTCRKEGNMEHYRYEVDDELTEEEKKMLYG